MSKKYSALIVDDDKFLLEMYRKKFEASGVSIDVAAGSEEALNKLRGGARPDLLILDIIMPTMDGIELLGVIREEKLADQAVVIMLSNESDPEKINAAKKYGIKGYIVKATRIPSEVVEEALQIADLNTKKN
jgi:two-component system, chemotaxis family, chemotaxis protein CheY